MELTDREKKKVPRTYAPRRVGLSIDLLEALAAWSPDAGGGPSVCIEIEVEMCAGEVLPRCVDLGGVALLVLDLGGV